ncbi:MAG: hypothetical protein DLM60_20780 [Pseudonocardiales bacterium]|nr:hypothetical protein [Actinomycetota bacterium]PZS13399.1 MAG: hypothetical protein DLM60_20780 [Pseudonocardiales bacterium]
MNVRPLEPADIPWAADLMESRRQLYALYSPVFWRPARGGTDLHARYLLRQIETGTNVGLRTDHGFIIGQHRMSEGFVDDFAIDPEATWAGDGRELLLATWKQLAGSGADALRVVTAKADERKVEMLLECSLRLVEQWWVKPLEATGSAATTGRVDAASFSGILGPAPPVYDPGGAVLLADRVAVEAELAILEREAAHLGAVLAVLPTEPHADREEDLRHRNRTVASQWYLGQPQSAAT